MFLDSIFGLWRGHFIVRVLIETGNETGIVVSVKHSVHA